MLKVNIEKVGSLTGHKDCVYALERAWEDHLFFSSGGDGQVILWNATDSEKGRLIAKLSRSVYSLHYKPDSGLLYIGQNFEGIQVIDPRQKRAVKSVKITNAAIFDIQSDNKYLYVACGDGKLVMMDLDSLEVVKRLKLSEKSVRSISLHPEKMELAAGCSDESIQLVDLESFAVRSIEKAHAISVFGVEYHPGKQSCLLSVSRDARIKAWDVSALDLQQEIPAHMFAINDLAFSPDHQLLATCSMDKSVKIWDAHSLRLLKVVDKARFAGHGTSVNKLLWIPYQNFLVSASDDRSLAIWKIDRE
ncbi:MAG: WD40 repeat domain-containing protein [Cytophagales bacterium]|nr:WD40 repeat domain-containing protein [Cytophagales bacterium]